MKLANKIALIAGAGSGMGRIAALPFAQEGATIAAIDLDEKAAQEPARMIETSGGKALAVKADVSFWIVMIMPSGARQPTSCSAEASMS